jgi:hypothetical protein
MNAAPTPSGPPPIGKPPSDYRTPHLIISGGQTGADRGSLDAATACGLPTGGWVPKGRIAEDGVVPSRYMGMKETGSAGYGHRTSLNVIESAATILFTRGPLSGGSALTLKLCKRHDRPCLHVNLAAFDPTKHVDGIRAWLQKYKPGILNVAGSRESKAPGIQTVVAKVLTAVFDPARPVTAAGLKLAWMTLPAAEGAYQTERMP